MWPNAVLHVRHGAARCRTIICHCMSLRRAVPYDRFFYSLRQMSVHRLRKYNAFELNKIVCSKC